MLNSKMYYCNVLVSSVYKINPITKLLCFILFLVSLFLNDHYFRFIFLICGIFMMFFLLFKNHIYLSDSFKIIILIVILLCFILNISIGSFLKIFYFMLYIYFSFFSTTILDRIYIFDILFFPLHIFRIPVHKLSIFTSVFISYIFLLLGTIRERKNHLSIMGIDYNHSNCEGKKFIYPQIYCSIFKDTYKTCQKIIKSLYLNHLISNKKFFPFSLFNFTILDALFIIIHVIIVL